MSLKSLNRRQALCLVASGLATKASAQAYPSRPIRILVAFTVGATDALARLYAQKLSEQLGVPVIVEAKPGAGQVLAIRTLQQSAPDGYTLYMGTGSSLAQGPGMRRDLPYDPLKDFTFLSMVATTPGVVVVHPELPGRNLRELVQRAMANPGKLNYGSAGVGAANHLQMELLMSRTGTQLTHVPYKNDVDMMLAISQGDVHVGLTTAQTAMPLIQSGKVRVLSATSRKRLSFLANIPALDESEVADLGALDPYSFFGLVGPAGMPAPVAARLTEAINKVSASQDVAARVRETLFSEPVTGSGSAAFRSFVQDELQKWSVVGRRVKLD